MFKKSRFGKPLLQPFYQPRPPVSVPQESGAAAVAELRERQQRQETEQLKRVVAEKDIKIAELRELMKCRPELKRLFEVLKENEQLKQALAHMTRKAERLFELQQQVATLQDANDCFSEALEARFDALSDALENSARWKLEWQRNGQIIADLMEDSSDMYSPPIERGGHWQPRSRRQRSPYQRGAYQRSAYNRRSAEVAEYRGDRALRDEGHNGRAQRAEYCGGGSVLMEVRRPAIHEERLQLIDSSSATAKRKLRKIVAIPSGSEELLHCCDETHAYQSEGEIVSDEFDDIDSANGCLQMEVDSDTRQTRAVSGDRRQQDTGFDEGSDEVADESQTPAPKKKRKTHRSKECSKTRRNSTRKRRGGRSVRYREKIKSEAIAIEEAKGHSDRKVTVMKKEVRKYYGAKK